jgi:hypothetical protein
MYRDDDQAHAARAHALIDEIARLEREKLAHAATDRRLEDARREYATLQPSPARTREPAGAAIHLAVFAAAALATFAAAYWLLL